MQNNKKLIYIVIGLLILAGLFLWLKPAKAPETNVPADSSAPIKDAKTFELAVKEGKVVAGPSTLTVGQGDRVTIKVVADVAGELHIHGYDFTTDLAKDVQGGIVFTANTTGRFPIELHEPSAEIAVLEVLPRQ